MLVGSAASIGNSGSGPSAAPVGATTVEVPNANPGPERVADRPADGVGHVGELGENEQRPADRPRRERGVHRPVLPQVRGERTAREQCPARGQHRERPGGAEDDRAGPGRHEPEQPGPRRQRPRAAEAARAQGEQEPGDDRVSQGRCRQPGPAGERERPAQRGVGSGERERRVPDIAEPGQLAGADHPAPGPPQQRAGEQHQAEREHADPARAGQGDLHVVGGQPQAGRRPHHPGQAKAGMRGGDPSGQHQRRENDQPGDRDHGRRERAGNHQWPGSAAHR